jgi:hypothetical protein
VMREFKAIAISVLPDPVGARRRMFCWLRSLAIASRWKFRGGKVVRVWKYLSIIIDRINEDELW